MTSLDPDDPRSPYLQVAGVLRDEIESGAIEKGTQLDSYSQLAARFAVSLGTVRSAIAALRTDGLVVSRPGKGVFVRTAADDATSPVASEIASLQRAVEVLSVRLDAVERRLPE